MFQTVKIQKGEKLCLHDSLGMCLKSLDIPYTIEMRKRETSGWSTFPKQTDGK